MGRVILLILLSGITCTALTAQQEREFREIDKNTYELYLDSSWYELIRTGENAIRKGTDYFYLRMRVGIAAYASEDYSKAIKHFKKALEFNSADDAAREYLYFAYSLYGREIEARNVAQDFTPSLTRKLSYHPGKAVRSFSLTATGNFIDDADIIDSYTIEIDPGVDGFQSVTRNFKHFGGALEHNAGKAMTIYHEIGFLGKTYMLYSQDPSENTRVNDATQSQFQYYLSGKILLGNGIFVIPAIQYLNVKVVSETRLVRQGRSLFITEENIYSHDFASSLTAERYFGKIRTGLSAGYSDINEQRQLQGSFSLSFFPSGNLNLYSNTEITRYSVPGSDSETDGWIFSQDAGFRMLPWLWAELGGIWGEMENFAGNRAYLVYNDNGPVTRQYGISLIAPFLNKGFDLFIHYRYILQESSFIPEYYISDADINLYEINYHKITGGIKWKF